MKFDRVYEIIGGAGRFLKYLVTDPPKIMRFVPMHWKKSDPHFLALHRRWKKRMDELNTRLAEERERADGLERELMRSNKCGDKLGKNAFGLYKHLRETEEELEQTTNALRDTSDELWTARHPAPEVVYAQKVALGELDFRGTMYVGLDGKIDKVGDRVLEATGLPVDELRGKDYDLFVQKHSVPGVVEGDRRLLKFGNRVVSADYESLRSDVPGDRNTYGAIVKLEFAGYAENVARRALAKTLRIGRRLGVVRDKKPAAEDD